jgi:hypothetical protein
MLVFFIGAILGAVQYLLLIWQMKTLHKSSKKTVFGIFMLKFMLYGITIALLMFKFNSYAENLIYGFIAAFPLCAVLSLVYNVFSKQIKNFVVFIFGWVKRNILKK